MLPNESLLIVLHFADYKTLLLTKLAAACFLRLANKFSEELARRRIFRVTFTSLSDTARIDYIDATVGAQRSVQFKSGYRALAAECRAIGDELGSHDLASLTFTRPLINTWNMPGVDVIFEARPLKYAEELVIHGLSDSTIRGNSEAFMSHFVGMKSLLIRLDDSGDFTDSAGRSFAGNPLANFGSSNENARRSIKELVSECVVRPRLLDEEALELDFSDNRFSGALGQRIIEMLKESRCEVTFRISLRDGDELMFGDNDYVLDVDNPTRRYASEESGIVVEVKGRRVAIQSTDDVPRTKRRSDENEEVLQMMAFVWY
ncbi:hypothetical protein AAVH_24646 [Aphelenchoides avenae]|nr:hypothetical protein AAVH_24646 [Aphelenchus avenae]